jgi:hypothetical protein
MTTPRLELSLDGGLKGTGVGGGTSQEQQNELFVIRGGQFVFLTILVGSLLRPGICVFLLRRNVLVR